jgi:Amt family ammonium transporter
VFSNFLKIRSRFPLILFFLLGCSLLDSLTPVQAQETTSTFQSNAQSLKLDTGDTAWMIVATVLVLLMTPGLAFFYGGLVRTRNALNTLMMSLGSMGLLGLIWVLVGYSLSFGHGGASNAFIGGSEFLGMTSFVTSIANIGAPSIPISVHAMFQGMFFIITPALISGTFVERIKFSSYLVFVALWSLLVYCPIAHWTWAPGGWISALGVMDFAGGMVVHTSAGFSALAAAILLGRRKGYGEVAMNPHSLPLCLLGGSMLWIGWCGFNGGSSLHADALAALALANTIVAACAAMFVWMLIDFFTRKSMTALGAITGAVVGLVAVTPASGFVSPLGAIAVGAISSAVCFAMVSLRSRGPVDDSLDVFAVHGIGGMCGTVLTGIFATGALAKSGVNPLAMSGLAEGGYEVFLKQVACGFIVAVFAFVMTFFLLKLVEAVMGLRVTEEEEELGLDLSQHGEEAYGEDMTGSPAYAG